MTPAALGPGAPALYRHVHHRLGVRFRPAGARQRHRQSQGQTVDLEQNLRIGKLIQGLRGGQRPRAMADEVRLTIEEDTARPAGPRAAVAWRAWRRRPMPASGCAGWMPSPSIWARMAGRTARRCSSRTRGRGRRARPCSRSARRWSTGWRRTRRSSWPCRPPGSTSGATGPTSRPRPGPPIRAWRCPAGRRSSPRRRSGRRAPATTSTAAGAGRADLGRAAGAARAVTATGSDGRARARAGAGRAARAGAAAGAHTTAAARAGPGQPALAAARARPAGAAAGRWRRLAARTAAVAGG